jgi:transcriptional regulator with XRE-family HTH domain
MSDLYLVLRSRLEDVQSWVTLGPEVIREAQQRIGLSDERVARQVPVSTRTWIRWRERGQIPAHSLDRVAKVLELEVERSRPVSVVASTDEASLPLDARLEQLEGRVLDAVESQQESLDALMRKVEDLTELVGQLVSRRSASTARRS